ncbi:MAG: M48 family metallopeptidase [Bacteroidota bacterium]
MKNSILRDLVILLGIFGLIWAVITLFPVFPEKPALISVEQEEELGDQYYRMLRDGGDFSEVKDTQIREATDRIMDRLTDALENRHFDYNLIVFRNDTVNAFALPGGYILVSTGLIAFCESPEELAAVIAHEMGHVEKRHLISRLVREIGLQLISSGDVYVTGEIARLLTSAGFDRKQEEAADRFACRLLEKAAIEPRSLSSLFRRLKEKEADELYEKFEIISSHPNFSSRIREVFSYEPAPDFEVEAFSFDWETVRKAAAEETEQN